MANFVFAILLLAFCLLGIVLRKIYYYLPAKELKRQAEGGDKLARTLWRAVAYDSSLRVLLWLWIGLSAAGGFVLLARVAPWFIALAATALLLWIAFGWFPRRSQVSGAEAKITMWLTPGIAWMLNYLHPVFDHTLAHLARKYPDGQHTNLYETGDLLEMIDRQASQSDNRISKTDLQRVKQVLTAHQYKVSDVLTPQREVKTVSDGDTVGLVLLDELHDSGQSSFPVRKGKTDKIIGTLYLRDLNLKTEGRVSDYMVADVRYLHEDDSLLQALQAFFSTKHQLFVVVNSFEEYVGVVTLEHIMQQLAGEVQVDDFDEHHDLAAVANKHAHDDDEPVAIEAMPEPVEVEAPAATVDVAEPEPEAELVTEDTVPATTAASEDPEIEAISMEDEAGEVTVEPVASDDPGSLAALDLPDEDEAPSPKKSKSKTPETDS